MEQSEFLAAAEKYKDMLFRIALNYFGNTYDADDMVQDVLVKLYINRKPFESEEHLRAWLIRVTVNTCKNTLRMPWRKKQVALEELSATLSFEQPEQSELFQSVMSLPEKHRMVLYLFYYEDLTVKQIAGVLKLSETAVTTRLNRSRNLLKKNLTEVWKDE